MSQLPDFSEVRDVVKNEVIDATNAYTLLTQLAFPLSNQRRLYEHYPYLIGALVTALTGQVLMPVCRLFDPDEDPRHASLTTFLEGIEQYHALDKNMEARCYCERIRSLRVQRKAGATSGCEFRRGKSQTPRSLETSNGIRSSPSVRRAQKRPKWA